MIVERVTCFEHGMCDGAIKQTGNEMPKSEMGGEPFTERSLAGRRRAVDGDDHADARWSGQQVLAAPCPGNRKAILKTRV